MECTLRARVVVDQVCNDRIEQSAKASHEIMKKIPPSIKIAQEMTARNRYRSTDRKRTACSHSHGIGHPHLEGSVPSRLVIPECGFPFRQVTENNSFLVFLSACFFLQLGLFA